MEMEGPKRDKQEKETDDDVSLWARLPEELIEAILAFLPVPSLIRVGAVCKKWRSVIKSADFKLRCSRVPARRPWLVVQESMATWRVYSPDDDVWYELPLSDLVGRAQLITGAPGLLCFEEMYVVSDELGLVVVDPISKHVTRLPRIELCREKSIALDVVEHSCPVVYRVVVLCYGALGQSDPDMVTRIFDSDVGSWRVSTSEFPFQASEVLSHAVTGGRLYCLLGNYLGGLQLVAYDIHGDSWTGIDTEGVPSLVSCRVVGCQGEVMLVFWGERMAAGNIQVFRMVNLTGAWTEMNQLPNSGVSKNYRTGTTTCLAAGGSHGEFYLHMIRRTRGHWRGRLVRYDGAEGTWSAVAYPRLRRERSVGVLASIVCFEPRWALHEHAPSLANV